MCSFDKPERQVWIMSKIRRIGTALGLAALVVSPIASANLLENGSFEQALTLNQDGGGWGYFDPSDVDGWSSDTNDIEIWNSGYNDVDAQDGTRFAELNAHPNTTGNAFTLFQDFDTVANENYHLTFAYRARVGQESFNVTVADLDMDIINFDTGVWTLFSGMFTASSESTRLMFTSINPDTETLGNFLDNVSVVAKVPEPGTLALLGLGLAGLGIARRRKS
jgi:hypothetical protein